MTKIKFDFLTKKYGPLPGWAWALVIAVGVYFLYRRFQGSGGGGGTTGTPADQNLMGADQAATAPGDLTSADTPANAANLDLLGNYPDSKLEEAGNNVAMKAHQLIDQLNSIGDTLDGTQGDPTGDATSTSGDSTDSSSAPLGLTHISGDFWWDSESHKLVKIPGSGGTKKGSGKKKIATKKVGGHKPLPRNKKAQPKHTVRTTIRKNKVSQKRSSTSPRAVVKRKLLPKIQPHTVPLNPVQRRAIAARNHPDIVRRPVSRPPTRSTKKVLPKRPTPRRK